ncbi:CHAP domain-containing protein [Dysosmobacter sp.]|uniref:CHAP domain-containing protein n=1 Tax=Dysosmobacter sp. TaxID=2591382 RepID=UPI002A9CFA70|nr:CHAP domain-containing protein [Dysosmobacter sp.]MCI6054589.1 CHAP domain-containing protein [Dysosmobacter sp.]MDY5510470.1 CHAP domain-containing protein [Dysosmobacter sp.]
MASCKDVLELARGEIGYCESPAGSNKTKYGIWFGLNGQPWCMMFLQWLFHQADAAALLPVKTASCGALMRAAQAAGLWVTGGYRPGDLVIYDFPGGGATDHCGIVEAAEAETVTAIEGNTADGNDANGGMVMRRRRSLRLVVGAIRPRYEEEEEETVVRYAHLSDIPSKFRPVIEALMNAGVIQGDGSDPAGNGDVIDLSHDQVRLLVFAYRGGAFDARLKAAGLEPAVK